MRNRAPLHEGAIAKGASLHKNPRTESKVKLSPVKHAVTMLTGASKNQSSRASRNLMAEYEKSITTTNNTRPNTCFDTTLVFTTRNYTEVL